jgi:hypothetical protein
MHSRLLTVATLLTLTLIGAASPIEAGTVLFVSDTTTDLDIATALTGDGHTVTTVTGDYAGGNATLKGDLSAYDAVFWSTSQHDPGLRVRSGIMPQA